MNIDLSYCNNMRFERTRMNYATPRSHFFKIWGWNIDKIPFIIKTTFQYQTMKMRVPAKHVAKGLMRNNHPGTGFFSGSFFVKFLDNAENQSWNISKKLAVKTPQPEQHYHRFRFWRRITLYWNELDLQTWMQTCYPP